MLVISGLVPLWAQSAADRPSAPGQTNASDPAPQVVKLLRAKTDPQVIQAFIQNWNTPYLTSADDLLQLRAAGASQALLDAYAQRGAELRLRYARAHPEDRQTVVFPTEQAPTPPVQTMGPEYPLFPFSDALGRWANRYPLSYPWPSYGYGFWGYPRRAVR